MLVGSYSVIGMSKTLVNTSTTLLTYELNTTTIHLFLRNVKVEPGLKDVMVLSDSKDSILPTIDMVDMSPFDFDHWFRPLQSHLTMCLWIMPSLHMHPCICDWHQSQLLPPDLPSILCFTHKCPNSRCIGTHKM